VNPAEAELALIGSLLTTNEVLHYASIERRLTPNHFLQRRLGALYAAMLALTDETGGYDRVSVVARAEKDGLPDAAAVADQATMIPPRLPEAKRQVTVVLEAAMDRTMKMIAHEILGDEVAGAERAEKAIAALMETLDRTARRRPKLIGGPLADVVEQAAARRTEGLSGIPSGIRLLDKLTGGWQPENLIIVGGRPGDGKSALGLQFATYAAKQGFTVGVWTLEMSDAEVSRRVIAAETGIPVWKMKRGGLSDWVLRDMLEVAREHAELPMWVDDITELSVAELRAKARRLHQRHSLDLIVVDYLQLLALNERKNRNDAVGEATRGLKILASELEIPVICLSQLNRDVEKRATSSAGKRPQLSDLRESGNIEQDANVVIFPFREGKHDEDAPSENAVEILVPKNRDGATAEPGDIVVTWVPEAMRFDDC
jgi:replicative DNA helicase